MNRFHWIYTGWEVH